MTVLLPTVAQMGTRWPAQRHILGRQCNHHQHGFVLVLRYPYMSTLPLRATTHTVRQLREPHVDRYERAIDSLPSLSLQSALAQRRRFERSVHDENLVAHLSTTRGQVEAGLREWGKTPLARYRDLGVLGPNSAPPEHETTVNSI